MGDVDAAFAEADVIVEGEFKSSTAHQGYIEPHSCTVQWNPDGSLVIYTSSQGSFTVVREQMATILRMPPSRIRVVPMEIGGGFGGKNRVYVEPIAAMLAKKTGKPVKLSMTREEVIQATGPTGGAFIRGRLGARRDGTFVAGELWMAYEAGAFPGSSVNGGMNNSFGPYDIPNVKLDGYDVVVNRPRNAAYRAPGVPGPTFAVESLVDELAERLDIEPMELRQKNAAKEGTRRPTGVVLGPNGNLEVMETIKNSAHYRSELSGKNRGRGVAVGFWTAGAGQHSINAHVNSDGAVMIDSAAVDIGGLRASEAMTMAEVLGIPYEDVKTRILDTDSIGWTGITAGSGTGAGTSASVHRAGMEIREKMIERAAQIWEVDASGVTYHDVDGTLSGPADQDGAERKLTFKEIARGMNTTGGFISGHADNGGATGGPTFSGHIVDVEVDPETGKVAILRYTCVEDVGQALHPSYVEGQIQGGAAQGIGMDLMEEYFYDEQGVLRNASLLDYRMPTTLDVPMIDTVLIQVPNPGHPYGVLGVGEPPIVPPLGAIANAIYAATYVRVHSMPATPRHLLDALLEQHNADKHTAAVR
jgi:CO/xanthine dehydrogenase Mo-binding subunit